ncbi:hypothetical protein [Leifsonia sp. Leaf264]|uniref:hypothetical protein n=1 Tax=Leifsonia sp. Leaf264 TaxID=1736314 RepID=UPI0006F9A5F3|nr:hypothetical protein [Leifsonia sp. Leaf264]KQO98413.1 hypothetical protein ASF30_10150 [Leifsonia sp. Leaf264]
MTYYPDLEGDLEFNVADGRGLVEIVIRRAPDGRAEHGTDVAVIFGGELSIHPSQPELSAITVWHEFACDVEGDTVKVAQYTFQDLTFHSALGRNVKFYGWLTGANFYGLGDQNPLAGAVKQDDENDHTANNGYKFTPPVKRFAPFRVEVEMTIPTTPHVETALRNRRTAALTDWGTV